ncbi:hypothetical protein I6E84_10985 [Psychrobacter sp. SCQQ22]|uniref:hypothetical protein n=1 Tax=Psychrobacter sp. SCQQ22 TaxID=2792059 RepID=UPI0018CD3636|nr:hypothetical protein [Psychrobacter sp. SCQQ22]MBH0086741.1 hypothetical protein [Psychrobacter sp. SCQQ22]
MIYKCVFTFAISFLICSCSTGINTPNAEASDSNIKIEKYSDANIREIEIGKAFSLDQIKSMTTFDGEFKKMSDVECGGFFTEEEIGESGEEAIYQYGNMEVDITDNQGAIMKIVGIPDGLRIKYNELLIDNNFNPKSLSLEKFEVYKNKATVSDNTVGIESTGIKTAYDIMYSVREKTSDNLLYLSFLDNKLVAIRFLVQC